MKNLSSFLLIFLITFSLLPVQFGGQQSADEVITGLVQPKIDGLLSDSGGKDLLGEWDDAKMSTEKLLNSLGDSVPFDLYRKMVADTFYLALIIPSDIRQQQLANISVQIDRDNDGSVSKGDLLVKLSRWGMDLQSNLKGSVVELVSAFVYTNQWEIVDDTTEKGFPLVNHWAKFALGPTTITQDEATLIEVEIDLSRIERDLSDLPSDRLTLRNAIDGDYEYLRYGISLGKADGLDFGYPISPDEQSEVVATYAVARYDVPTYMPSLDVWIEDLDVMQATMKEDDRTTLVQTKDTLLRVFIGHEGTDFIPVRVTVDIYESFLFTVSHLETKTVDMYASPSPDKQLYNDSANFELSAELTNRTNLFFEVSVEDYTEYWDPDMDNNEATRLQLFEYSRPLNTIVIPINKAKIWSDRVLPVDSRVNYLTQMSDFMIPSGNARFIKIPWESFGLLPYNDSDRLKSRLDRVWDSLVAERRENMRNGDPYLNFPHQLVGVTPYGWDNKGGSSTPTWTVWGGRGRVSWISQHNGGGGSGMMHEINHNLGPSSWGHHVTGEGYGCGAPDGVFSNDGDWDSLYGDNIIHDYGWNPVHGLIGGDKPELMTYCSDTGWPLAWLGNYRWQRLFDRFQSLQLERSVTATAPGSLGLDADNTAHTYRQISGYVEKGGNAVLEPSFEVSGFVSMPSMSVSNPDMYLRVNYINGTALDIPMRINFRDIENSSTDRAHFYRSINDDGQITGISVINATTNAVMDSKTPQNYNTNAALQYPSTIKRNTAFDIYFNINSDNKTNLYTQLFYSPDGNGYYPVGDISTNMDSRPAIIDTLPGGSSHFKLLVSDGFETKTFTGSNINVEYLPPSVTIDQNRRLNFENGEPTQNQEIKLSVVQGEVVSIEIQSQDEYGRELQEFEYKIRDLVRNVIVETRPDRPDLERFRFKTPGTYEIIVTGSDPRTGLTDTDAITVIVSEIQQHHTLTMLDQFREDLDAARQKYGDKSTSSHPPTSSEDSDSSNLLPISLFPVGFVMVLIPILRRNSIKKLL